MSAPYGGGYTFKIVYKDHYGTFGGWFLYKIGYTTLTDTDFDSPEIAGRLLEMYGPHAMVDLVSYDRQTEDTVVTTHTFP